MLAPTIQNAQEVRCHFALSLGSTWMISLTSRRCFRGGHQNFLCQPQIPEVLEGTEPTLRSHLLGTLIEYFLSTIFEILDLPSEDDLIYLSSYDKLSSFGKSESEIYSLISVNGEKPNIATYLKPDYCVISKWFIRNISCLFVFILILHKILNPLIEREIIFKRHFITYPLFKLFVNIKRRRLLTQDFWWPNLCFDDNKQT